MSHYTEILEIQDSYRIKIVELQDNSQFQEAETKESQPRI